MKHLKKITSVSDTPQAAMGASSIVGLIGTILTSVGGVLVVISPFLKDY